MTVLFALFQCALVLAAPAQAQDEAPDVTVQVDPARASDWAVSKQLFGRFFEFNGRDGYPGLYAQHLANGSFEPWYGGGREPHTDRNEVIFDVQPHRTLPYPWQPVGEGAVFFDTLPGGPNGERFQRVSVFGTEGGGIAQRTALPDERTLGYDLALFLGGTATALRVALVSEDGVEAEATLPVPAEMTRDTVRLTLPRATSERYPSEGGVASPFGVYTLHLTIEGRGHVNLDGLMLMAGDAVRGKYNPTTIKWLKEYNVTSMRWPGGNWASAYRWEDGIGPLMERPIRANLAWGGLDPNYMGINEFLEFCELVGMEPYVNVAFNYADVPPEEAAHWVAYVNDDTTTAMGQLRAAHGYPEPWDVQDWQVGNESYGAYQIGHTDAETYARQMRKYVAAMKAADPSITVVAASADPLYTDWDGRAWNETLLEIAGDRVEAVDIHRYVRGAHGSVQDLLDEERDRYLRDQIAFPSMFETFITDLRVLAAERGVPNLDICVGEWNGNPRVKDDWPSVDYPAMAHAAFVAGMYQAFIRQGDAVRWSHQRDNTLYFRPFDGDFRPINPGAHVLKIFSEPFADAPDSTWQHLPLTADGPTFDQKGYDERQRDTPGVPYVDVAAVTDGAEVVIFLTNRDLKQARTVQLSSADGWAIEDARAVIIDADDPFARQLTWDGPETFGVREETLDPSEGLLLRPAAVARVTLRLPPR